MWSSNKLLLNLFNNQNTTTAETYLICRWYNARPFLNKIVIANQNLFNVGVAVHGIQIRDILLTQFVIKNTCLANLAEETKKNFLYLSSSHQKYCISSRCWPEFMYICQQEEEIGTVIPFYPYSKYLFRTDKIFIKTSYYSVISRMLISK